MSTAPPANAPALGNSLRTLASMLAQQAGSMVLEGRRAGLTEVYTKSTATDMVTEFDRASERLIVGELARLRPLDGVIGEEGSSVTGTSGINWLIDPIDGTTNYLYGLSGYNVSIAATLGPETIAAAVFLPVTNELFSASIGGGATLNGLPIRCGTTSELSQALVSTGFSYQPARRIGQAQRLTRIIGEIRDIRRLGAAAADLCFVAAGRIDAYFEEGLGPWDLAAGELIAREAGCISGDFQGGPVHPEQVLVANPLIFQALQDLIQQRR